ncbi:MAG: YheV family putative zinc ribbon protein [Acinetobacter radioresistens]
MNIKRRFIAGVRCPKCEALDKIIMLTTEDDEWIECIECSYSDRRPNHIEQPQEVPLPDDVGVIQFKPRQKQ